MRKGWIAVAVCAGVAAGLVLATTQSSQAAMVVKGNTANMSLIEQVAKKGKMVCTDYLIMTCCQKPGKPEVCKMK